MGGPHCCGYLGVDWHDELLKLETEGFAGFDRLVYWWAIEAGPSPEGLPRAEFLEFDVDPEDALIAFNHPYAYVSQTLTDDALAA